MLIKHQYVNCKSQFVFPPKTCHPTKKKNRTGLKLVLVKCTETKNKNHIIYSIFYIPTLRHARENQLVMDNAQPPHFGIYTFTNGYIFN
jgi:hypothetical protein